MTATVAGPALSLRSLSVDLGGRRVLRGLDLEIARGEWLGIIGPNGAGKSTLLHAIAGVRSFGGAIVCGDAGSPSAREVALVPQTPVLPPGMTVAEYVLLGRTAHLGWLERESAHDRDMVVEVLARLDLGEFAHREITELSGGEAQRVVVARALAQGSPILLLDEPTSALDVGHQNAVLELVDALRLEHGLTVVAAMHDLATAARFADRLALLHDGIVGTCGPPADVLDPAVLSEVYGTEVRVVEVDGELVVLPRRRRPSEGDD